MGAKFLPCFGIYQNNELKYLFSDEISSLDSYITSLNLISSLSIASKSTRNSFLFFQQNNYQGDALKLFISGDRSSVGKSTTCQYLLASFLSYGLSPKEIAYIKPITQCEEEQSVVRYCQEQGIECLGVGPVVFYKGFTRAFLDGKTETSEELLNNVKIAVENLSKGKKLVIIDGVGYPSVGSICGVSNADSAKILDSPVLIVSKSGVGDAIDSFNLNAR